MFSVVSMNCENESTDNTSKQTYVDVLEIGLLHQLWVGNPLHFHMPHTEVEVGAPCHHGHDLDVLTWKHDRVGLVLQ